MSNLLNQNGVGEKLLSTTDENGGIFSSTGHRLYQRISNITLAYVWRIQRTPSVSSVCLAYDERMGNVLYTLAYAEQF